MKIHSCRSSDGCFEQQPVRATCDSQKSSSVSTFLGSQLACIRVGAAIVCWLIVATAARAGEPETTLQIKAVIPTGIFPQTGSSNGPAQIVDVTLHNGGPPAQGMLRISLGQQPSIFESLDEIVSGNVVHSIQLPDNQEELPLNVALYVGTDGELADQYTVKLPPSRKWTIYHVAVSHHDLGYADYYHMMRRDVREWGIERALQFCTATDAWAHDSQYRWTVETSEPLVDFLQSASKSKRQELVRRIREGRIELGALHNSANTEGMSYEALARLFYTPNRHVVDLLGITPRKTALLDDVVGLTRPLPLYSKEADIPYFYHGRNQLQDQLQPASAYPVYYWRAPDGDRERMTLFRTQHYHLRPNEFGQDLMALNLQDVRKLVKDYSDQRTWPYDAILCVDSWDFSIPQMEKVRQIREWNRKYAYPRVVCATMTMFFDHIAAEMDRERIFVFDKDAPNTWIDQDYSDAEAAAKARELGYSLPTVEKFSTLAMSQGGNGYPWTDIWQAYHRLLMYHEHTNAAYAEGPIYAPPSLKDKSAANALYYEAEVEMHRRLVHEAQGFAENATQRSFARIQAAIPTTSDQTVVVFNPLNWPRTDVVHMDARGLPEQFTLQDQTTRAEIPWQRLADGSIVFMAENVPSLGYKTYALTASKQEAVSQRSSLEASETRMENEFYRLTFDMRTGAITSLYDKELERELVDTTAAYRFNEYLYHHVEGKNASWERAESARLTSQIGPVAGVMSASVIAPGTKRVQQDVILYRGLKRIDFVQRMEKASCGRTLADYKTSDPELANHGKEAVFYALPFAVPDFQIKHELSGSVVEPIVDQSVGSSTDYYNIQHFSDLSNADFGVTIAARDCGLVQYGHPRPSQSWRGESILEKPRQSHLYFYLMNNWFGTNIRIDQPGPKTFRWSLRSHPGNWQRGRAYEFGWDASHPLVPRLVNGPQDGSLPAGEHSFLQVDEPNVVLTTLKPAEANGEGFILRFNELAGEATDVSVRLAFLNELSAVTETSLIENDRVGQITIQAPNQISFAMRPHGVKTIRVQSAARVEPADKLEARGLRDMEVQLNWQAETDTDSRISHYDIYRGTTEDFQVGLENWVGRSMQSTHIDRPRLHYGGWIDNTLQPDTTYYYRIRPVDCWNNFGSVSAVTRATTLKPTENASAPARVQGLYVVSVSPVTRHNYLALWFYTNCESDVTRYRIYRSQKPGCDIGPDTLLHEIDAMATFTHTTPHGFGTVTRELREYNRILYVDQQVQPGTTYYYRVQAVDRRGVPGRPSLEAAASTK
jgi:hypothetical protein